MPLLPLKHDLDRDRPSTSKPILVKMALGTRKKLIAGLSSDHFPFLANIFSTYTCPVMIIESNDIKKKTFILILFEKRNLRTIYNLQMYIRRLSYISCYDINVKIFRQSTHRTKTATASLATVALNAKDLFVRHGGTIFLAGILFPLDKIRVYLISEILFEK